jgi:para-nitrobenzyl esterase
MSTAWINFARYGNPNHRNIPKWQAYTKVNGATMIFNNTCKLVHHHDKNLLDLVIENN